MKSRDRFIKVFKENIKNWFQSRPTLMEKLEAWSVGEILRVYDALRN